MRALADIFPQSNPVGGRIAAIDKKFELPQVWRTSLGVDFKLPLNMLLSLEGIYTKDINAINFDNINLADAASTVTEGPLDPSMVVKQYKCHKVYYTSRIRMLL